MISIMSLDEIDERIVAELLSDGRASFAAVGERVNLSAPAVKRRVDRLRGAGVITGFSARVDPARTGWSTEAYVEVYSQRNTPTLEILERIQPMPEVVEAFTVTGEADALLHVFAADVAHVERVLSQVAAMPFVVRTKSVLVLSPLLRRSQPVIPADGQG